MKALVLLVLSLTLQDREPMDVEDVLALSSVRDVALSPDGRLVAYVVSRMDFEENRHGFFRADELWRGCR